MDRDASQRSRAALRPHPSPAEIYRSSANAGLRLFLVLFFLTIAFDFRRAEGDASSLVVVLGLASLACGVFYVSLVRQRMGPALVWLLPFFLLVWVGTITGLLYGQEIYDVISRCFPVLIFCCAVLAVAAAETTEDKVFVLKLAALACVVSSLFKILFGFIYFDLDFEIVRYQIVSGALPLLFAYGLTGFLVGRRAFTRLAFLLAIAIVVISVTRTYVLVFLVSVAVGLFAQRTSGSKLGYAAILLALVAPLGLLLLTTITPGLVDRWIERFDLLQETGIDLTASIRLAEIDFQWGRLKSEILGMLFGFGHAAPNELSGDYRRLAASVLGREAVANFEEEGYGHNMYVGLLYVGGLVCAVPIFAAFASKLSGGLRLVRVMGAHVPPLERFLLVWGLTAMAGYLAFGFLGGTFGDRSNSFFFGVSAGLVFIGSRIAAPANGSYVPARRPASA